MNEENTFDSWCLLELFGHQRLAGRVSEQTIGGCAFLRVDVPAVEDLPPFTKFYSQGAIYAMTPVTEEIARAAVKRYRIEPVTVYDIPELAAMRRQPALPGMHDDEDDLRDY